MPQSKFSYRRSKIDFHSIAIASESMLDRVLRSKRFRFGLLLAFLVACLDIAISPNAAHAQQLITPSIKSVRGDKVGVPATPVVPSLGAPSSGVPYVQPSSVETTSFIPPASASNAATGTATGRSGLSNSDSGNGDPNSDPVVSIPEPANDPSGTPTVVQSPPLSLESLESIAGGPKEWTSPDRISSSLQVMLLLTVLSLAPAILLMTTCYVRIIIVLGLLRQAVGLQSMPPSQVMTSIALFMTLFIMSPVWTEVYHEAIVPYSDPEIEMSLEEAYHAGALPVRRFMSKQIVRAGNQDDVLMFYNYMGEDEAIPSTFADVPIKVLLPAYILSELKTAFMMGFQIYLPFLIIDLVVASVTISMGMLMLPPQVISLPFKLLLFVLVDGWRRVVMMLMDSFF